jgi:putative membrane protein
MTTGQRILFNAIATYGRTLLAIFLGLFSSRWILAALGDIDYGLMGVVGGILVFITYLNSLSTSATARFFAFSIGQNDVEETRKWFNAALSFEAVVPITLVVIGFFIGELAIKNFLSIPPDRLETALWVFRISLITAFVTMTTAPFIAMYTAKQNIAELSFWGMGVSLCTFIFAYTLTTLSGNHWLIYSSGLSLITCTFCILQSLRSYRKYPECKIVFKYWFDKKRLKEMTSYSCWTLFGALGGIFNSTGMGIVLNKFFPPLQFPAINASYSVGSTIAGHTQNISGALMGAFMPEIVSSEGRGDRAGVIRQMFRAARLSYIIISIIAIPILFETEFILKAWLQNPPEHAALFCRTLLIAFLISRTSAGFDAAICATGKIRNYQLVMSSWAYLSIGVCALLLFWGGGLYSVCGVIIGYNIVNVSGGVFFCKKLVGISVRSWICAVVMPVFLNLAINISFGIFLLLITQSMAPAARFFLITPLILCFTTITSWKLLLDVSEKAQCRNIFHKFKSKIITIVRGKKVLINNPD